MSLKQVRRVLSLLMLLPFGAALGAQAAERKVSWQPPQVIDPLSGIAIYGYDPVGYYTEPEPVEGSKRFEWEWQGNFWWFSNANNREIFRRHPEVYAPRFGGFDPIELSNGSLVGGEPRFYLMRKEGVYFFASLRNSVLFQAEEKIFLAKAEQTWEKKYGNPYKPK